MSERIPLQDIEQTVWRVLRLAYLRPLLKGSSVKAFQLSDEEISNMLDGFEANIASDMEVLSECLKAAQSMGAHNETARSMDDTIVLHGNREKT